MLNRKTRDRIKWNKDRRIIRWRYKHYRQHYTKLRQWAANRQPQDVGIPPRTQLTEHPLNVVAYPAGGITRAQYERFFPPTT